MNVSTTPHTETRVWASLAIANRGVAESKRARREKDSVGYERTVRARSSISGKMLFKS